MRLDWVISWNWGIMRYMVGGIVCKSLMGVAWNRFISTSKKGAISQSLDDDWHQ